MVWGAFSAASTGELLHCEKSINAFEYSIILQKGLLPSIEKLFSKVEQSDYQLFLNKTMLQCSHSAKTTKTWLENRHGQSPDLNPIKNIWSHVKHKLTGKHFSSTHQLFETINIECNNIDSSFCKKLSTSLPTMLKHLKKINQREHISHTKLLYVFNSCLFPDKLFVVKTIKSLIFRHFGLRPLFLPRSILTIYIKM